MQHQFDEYSVTDIRHTVGEVLRVIRERRWHFYVPFCVVGALLFAASLFVPRQYTATTVLRRDNDAVLANMMGRSWKEPYTEIKAHMATDLKDEATLLAVLDELDLPIDAARFDDRSLTPAGDAARLRLANEVARGLTVKSQESSAARDVVSLSLSMANPSLASPILATLRDVYLEKSRRRTTEILDDAQRFLESQVESTRAELSNVRGQLTALELQYPGIDPTAVDPNQSELTALGMERVALERQREQLEHHRQALEEARSAKKGDVITAPAALLSSTPNPRRAELVASLGKLRQELTTLRTTKRMTEAHPSVVQLRSSVEAMEAELAQTPERVELGDDVVAGPVSLDRIEQQLADLDGKLAATRARRETVQRMTAEVESRRADVLGHRDEYHRLRQKADRIESELKSWQDNVKPVAQMRTAQHSGRSIHFATIRDVEQSSRPTYPAALLVIGICLAVAAATGVVTVLAREFLDHSYRTVKHLSSSLGVPVIESIDLIVTRAQRKRRLAWNMLAMPVLAALLFAALTGAGTAAYLSLEQPAKLVEIKSKPHRAIQIVFEPGVSDD